MPKNSYSISEICEQITHLPERFEQEPAEDNHFARGVKK
jgi:hypothetical protein